MASVFSGKAGRNAAIWQSGEAAKLLEQLNQLYGTGFTDIREVLDSGFSKAGKTLDKGIKNVTQNYKDYGAAARRNITAGGQQAMGYLDQAIGTLNERYGQATGVGREAADAWQPVLDENMKGFRMLSDALGLGGAEGNQRATEAFQVGPGYQFQVDQATDAAARSANARGMGYSGNTTDAITRLSSNLANQEFQQWIGNLQPYQTGAHNATAGMSGALQQLAGLYGQWGQSVAGVQQDQSNQAYQTHQDVASSYTHQGDQIGGAKQNYYSAKAGLPVAHATAQANVTQAHMGANAEALSNFYNTHLAAGKEGMMAGQQAAANKMGAWMGALDLAGKAIGGAWNTPFGGGAGGAGGGTAGGEFIKRIFS